MSLSKSGSKKIILKSKNYPKIFTGALIGAAFIVVAVAVLMSSKPVNPIPKAILKAVPYAVYYPDQGRLPAGYTLDVHSIQRSSGNVVEYFIDYADKQMIVVFEQTMPAQNTISHFTSTYMPLHTTFWTPMGNAILGAINYGKSIRSVVSLPINNGPWIIATAPSNINQKDLEQVINSLIRS